MPPRAFPSPSACPTQPLGITSFDAPTLDATVRFQPGAGGKDGEGSRAGTSLPHLPPARVLIQNVGAVPPPPSSFLVRRGGAAPLLLLLLAAAAVEPVARHERDSAQVVPEALADGLDVGLLQAPVEVKPPQLALIVGGPETPVVACGERRGRRGTGTGKRRGINQPDGFKLLAVFGVRSIKACLREERAPNQARQTRNLPLSVAGKGQTNHQSTEAHEATAVWCGGFSRGPCYVALGAKGEAQVFGGAELKRLIRSSLEATPPNQKAGPWWTLTA